jgi:hypothetical protein
MCSAYSFPGVSIIEEDARKYNAPLDIIEMAVCKAFFVEPEILHSKTRKREVVKARHTFYWLAKKYTLLSLARIGLHFKQDHANVLQSIEQVDNMIDSKDKAFLPLIRTAENKLISNIAIKQHENRNTKQNSNQNPPAQSIPVKPTTYLVRNRFSKQDTNPCNRKHLTSNLFRLPQEYRKVCDRARARNH